MDSRLRILNILAASIALVGAVLVPPAAQARSQFFPGMQAGWWVNCSLGWRADDCVVSIETQNASGQWITGQVIRNPKYEYLKDDSSSALEEGCGSGESIRGDACYVFAGLGDGGKDLMVWVLMGLQKESVGGAIKAVNGSLVSKRKSDGYPILGLPKDSIWRLTLRSKSLAENGDWLQGIMYDPNYTVLKDKSGAVITGRVIEQHQSFEDDDACSPTAKPAAQSFSNYFDYVWHFNVSPYLYQMEKAKGLPPGGLLVSQNGTCGTGASFDRNTGSLWINMGGAHFAFNGEENKGFVEATLRSDFLKAAFGIDAKTMNRVQVEVTYASGEKEIATSTTKYESSSNTVEIRGYGFHFSAPTIKMKIRSAGKATSTTITCVKGKSVKKVSGTKPRCPSGYKLK